MSKLNAKQVKMLHAKNSLAKKIDISKIPKSGSVISAKKIEAKQKKRMAPKSPAAPRARAY